MKVTVNTNDGHDDDVASQGEGVQRKEHDKQGELVLTEAGETLENQLSDESTVLSLR